MKRSLKVLGLALVAIFAFGAVAASSAMAALNSHHFTVKPPAIITGTQEPTGINRFTTTNNAGEIVSEVKCKHSTLEGTASQETNKELTLTTTFPVKNPTKETEQNCTAFGLNMETITNHCALKLTGGPTVNGDAPIEKECSGGSVFEIKIPSIGCTLKIGPQTEAELEKGAHYIDTKNPATEKQDITVEITATSVSYTTEGFCPASGNGTSGHTETLYTLEAFEDTNKAGCAPTETAKTTPTFKDNEGKSCEGKVIDLTGNTLVTEQA